MCEKKERKRKKKKRKYIAAKKVCVAEQSDLEVWTVSPNVGEFSLPLLSEKSGVQRRKKKKKISIITECVTLEEGTYKSIERERQRERGVVGVEKGLLLTAIK